MKSRVNSSGLHRDEARPAPGTVARPGARRPGLVALRLLPAAALLAACDGADLSKYPQTTFKPASQFGESLNELFYLTLWLGVAVGILVFVLLAYIVVRFRYRPDAPEPEQIHGNTRLEIAWTLFPALILAVIAVPTVQKIFETQPDPSTLPPETVTIDVIGKQWWWEARYVNGTDTIRTANEIHVPVGRPVHLRLLSDNVIHSFWVPQMGGKRDLIPNRVNHLVFTPLEPGIYLGQCAEFCGDSHALMKMRMVAHAGDGFERWLANEASPAAQPAEGDEAVALGKQLFNQVGCVGCHVIRGHEGAIGVLGPDLTHLAQRRTIAGGIMENNAANLHAWIINPTYVKPGSKMPQLGWTEDQTRYIVAYLQTLE